MIFLWIVQTRTESPVDAVAVMMISYVQIYNLTLKMQGHVATAACSQRGDFSAHYYNTPRLQKLFSLPSTSVQCRASSSPSVMIPSIGSWKRQHNLHTERVSTSRQPTQAAGQKSAL